MSTEIVSAMICSTRESTPLCPRTGVTRDAHPDKSAPAAPIDTKKLRRDWRRSATHSIMFVTPERRDLVPASLHFMTLDVGARPLALFGNDAVPVQFLA